MNLSKKKKIILAVGTVLFLAVVCGFVAVMAIGGNREGNAQEQLSLGERYLAEMDYERAVAAFELVIELEPRNIDAYIGLSKAYEGLGDTDLAMEALETAREKIQELVREGEALPDSAAEGYLMLVRMYDETGNYEEARLLLEEALSVTDSAELQEIWEAYVPEVEFSLAAGEYEEGTELTLTTEGQAVYYTLDGSDPVKEGEGAAEVVIVLQEGNWTIRAAAEGKGGTLGDVTEVEYVVVAVESTEETEPEGIEEPEEETEPESDRIAGIDELEIEDAEGMKEGRDTAIIRFVISEVLVQFMRAASDLHSDEIQEVDWKYETGYPNVEIRDITGTITVFADNAKDIVVERNFEFEAEESVNLIEIEVPYRDVYHARVSAEGYFNFESEIQIDNISSYGLGYVYLYPIDVNLDNVVEIKFLDKTGNLIYPEYIGFGYQNTEGEFIDEPHFYLMWSQSPLKESLYIKYADGVTLGIRLYSANQDFLGGDRVYPIIPDQNGVAYVELSDFDIENMPYHY